jgi:hypothetical protein
MAVTLAHDWPIGDAEDFETRGKHCDQRTGYHHGKVGAEARMGAVAERAVFGFAVRTAGKPFWVE